VLRKKNIENHSDSVIDEEHLLAYLEGSMLPGEQHRIEEILEADPFLNDAVEGLSEIKDKQQLRAIAAQINAQLSRQIQSRRKQRRSRPKTADRWGWIFALILLLLVLISWWVMKVAVK
jgi:anti-sigma factor RsiW